jgi:hypothetical protein
VKDEVNNRAGASRNTIPRQQGAFGGQFAPKTYSNTMLALEEFWGVLIWSD